jgi:hypothetical protein
MVLIRCLSYKNRNRADYLWCVCSLCCVIFVSMVYSYMSLRIVNFRRSSSCKSFPNINQYRNWRAKSDKLPVVSAVKVVNRIMQSEAVERFC